MTTTSKIRNSGISSVLFGVFAGAVGLAVTTSGCVIDSGPDSGYGGGCEPDLLVDWQIQTSTQAPVTCGGAGAATVVVTVGTSSTQLTCAPDKSEDSFDVLLLGQGMYNVTVGLFDAKGNSLAPAQSISVDANSCGSFYTPSPALLVVSPPPA